MAGHRVRDMNKQNSLISIRYCFQFEKPEWTTGTDPLFDLEFYRTLQRLHTTINDLQRVSFSCVSSEVMKGESVRLSKTILFGHHNKGQKG